MAEQNDLASEPKRLRDLLRQRAAEVAAEVAQDGGPVPAEKLEQLERISRLVELCGGEAPKPRRRWPMAVVVGGTLVLVSLLLFTRVAETEIELDVAAEEVGFSSPEPQVLADVMDLTTLGVSGLEEIRIPRSRGAPARTVRGPAGAAAAIQLSPAPDGGEGSISLAGLTLPAGAQVRLEPSESGRRVRVSLERAPQELRVDVYGTIRIGVAGEGAEILELASPRSILLRCGEERVDLDLGLADGAPGSLARQLLAEDLVLSRIEEYLGERSLVRHVSTVLSGVLYFESLSGEARPLRPGEALRFKESRGEIRTLDLADDHLGLKFRGRVRDMATGSEEHPRSLMPTSLDWIRARHGLTLLWGTTLYLTGLVVSLLRWWRISI